MKKGCFFLIFLVILGISVGGWEIYKRKKEDPQYKTEKADKGDIKQIISATGSLAAYTTVEVGCQISGIVASIAVDFNDFVSAGQLIAQIDPATLEAKVLQATANLENARSSERNVVAQLENLRASMLTAKSDEKVTRANAKKAQVQMEDAKRNLTRMRELYNRKLVSTSDFETSQTNLGVMEASLEAAKAQIESSQAKQNSVSAQISAMQANLEGEKSRIKQMEAQLNVEKINLSRTQIYSPIDGVIISRNVDVGQTVAASLQAPTLFTIAQDLRKMQINTSVDEADIGRVSKGQKVTFNVDAYRGREFIGAVHQVRLAPTLTQNVVNYAVMVNVENPDFSLKPGMTANVEIMVSEKTDVIRIPTRALYFKPSSIDAAEKPVEQDESEEGAKKFRKEGEGPQGREGGEGRERWQGREGWDGQEGEERPEGQEGAERLEGQERPEGQKEREESEGRRSGEGRQSRQNRQSRQGKEGKESKEGKEGKEGKESKEGRQGKKKRGTRIWILSENLQLKPLWVKTGEGNNSFTEVTSGNVVQGTEIVIGEEEVSKTAWGLSRREVRKSSRVARNVR